MARKLLRGIASVKLGAPGANGVMGVTLAKVGKLVNDSISLNFSEPQKNKITVEDLTSPLIILTDPNVDRMLEFTTFDYDVNNIAKFFGGTVATGKWSAPTEFSAIEQSVEVVTKDVDGTHYLIEVPLANISATMTGKMGKNGLGEIKVSCEVLTPFNAAGDALSSITITEVTA